MKTDRIYLEQQLMFTVGSKNMLSEVIDDLEKFLIDEKTHESLLSTDEKERDITQVDIMCRIKEINEILENIEESVKRIDFWFLGNKEG